MKNKRGLSKLTLLILVALIIAAVYFWIKYFSEPLTTVVTGGAEQSLPALDTAKKVSEQASKAVRTADEATKKLNEDMEK
ncbi:MAG TPA: hypothetical protein P5294_06775 [Smithellaceae bacterium]|nr:hypothetical protein [Smithellaceae bacterium]HRS88883.1 hypothetical protein [Smithellaceae bacterium]HRV26222.1 hypothetical protein [Smithellaceae bacterium]